MNKVILFAANRGFALSNSRKELIEKFINSGWKVIISTANDNESRKLQAYGAILETTIFNRGGFSPLSDWIAFTKLQKVLRKYSPSVAHFFNAKPVIMGTLAARKELKDKIIIINTITGLGHAFIKKGMVTRLASAGYRSALPRADMTIFQNRDDHKLFLKNKWVTNKKSKLVIGAGVSLEHFTFVDRSKRDLSFPIVVMLGRLINQKGIPEFAKVAYQVRKAIPHVRFFLAGEEDPIHPDAVNMDWLKNQTDFEYVGNLSDVKTFLNKADILLFTSYREGMPRVIMEASAMGLATVAFDVSGVREAVKDGKTGYLVASRDVEIMTSRVLELLHNKRLRLNFGLNAYEMAKKKFDLKLIHSDYFKIYQDLGVYI